MKNVLIYIYIKYLFFIRRLIKAGQNGKILSQKIIDILFKDFDQSLRELGAGDLSVGKFLPRLHNSVLENVESIVNLYIRSFIFGSVIGEKNLLSKNLNFVKSFFS